MAYKYVNDERLQESLEAVRDRLVIKDKTEAQALVASASYPHCVYYTNDTNCIVVNGQIYGRGAELGSAFGFATDTSGMATWDTNRLYITPTSTSGIYQVYSYENNSWEMPGTITIDIPVSADAITYDLTNTPDLGEGDVQSAIEAVDAKVEDVDQRIDDEKVKFIKERFPSQNVSNYSRTTVNYKVEIVNGVVTYTSNSSYRTGYYSKPIPKGSLCNLNLYYSSAPSGWGGISFWGYSTQNPIDYIASNGSIVGLPTTSIKISYTAGVWIRDLWYMMPEDGYLICAYQNTYDPTFGSGCYIYDSMSFKDWYNKGLADGSAMASIVGLGYNVWDYISGAVDMAGFEYGCKIYKDYIFKPTVSLREKWSRNTSLVYFPKFDMTGLPTSDTFPLYRFLQYTTSLKIVPDLTFANNVQFSLSESFQYSGVVYVGSFVNLKITNIMACFKECRSLLSVGNLDTSLITTWRTGANQIFVNTSTDGVKRVESLDFTSTTDGASNEAWISNGNLSGLRYIVIKNIGTASGCTSIAMTRLTQWGIPHASYPSLTSDARQSLIDTLLTYSFDRATAGYSACTITLSANTKALLTDEEKEQITTKGYTIA